MVDTKNLTKASLLSSLFIIITLIFVSTSIGCSFYLDFIASTYYALVYLSCKMKYTILSAITSLLIILLVLGNIAIFIWASQSIILGIICAYFISKDTTILDDIVISSIFGIIVMVFIDIYFSKIIGYSFINEAKIIVESYNIENILYLVIATVPLGTILSIFISTFFVADKLNFLKGHAKRKLLTLKNIKVTLKFMCCSNNLYYAMIIFIIFVEILNYYEIYIFKTFFMASKYVCIYFVLRDSYSDIQNYLLFRKINIRFLSIITIPLLVFMFKLTFIALVILDILLIKFIKIKSKQINIVNNYIKQK